MAVNIVVRVTCTFNVMGWDEEEAVTRVNLSGVSRVQQHQLTLDVGPQMRGDDTGLGSVNLAQGTKTLSLTLTRLILV